MRTNRMRLMVALIATTIAPTLPAQSLGGQRTSLTDTQVQQAIDAGIATPAVVPAIRRASEPPGFGVEVLTPAGSIQELAATRVSSGRSIGVADVPAVNRAPMLLIRVRPAGPNRATLSELAPPSKVTPHVLLVGANGDVVRPVSEVYKLADSNVQQSPPTYSELTVRFGLSDIDRLLATGDFLEVVVVPDQAPGRFVPLAK